MSLRSDLIRDLQKVEPALAINQLIPLLTHYWFIGTHLLAYNGQIALQVPFETDFQGAVPGKFLELLRVETHGNEDIKLTHSGPELVIKQGRRTNFRLAMLEPNFLFQMPKGKPREKLDEKQKKSKIRSMNALIDAIKHCLISVGRDTSTVEQLGITLEPDGNETDSKSATLYATDGATISRSHASIAVQARAILPTKFCEQMVFLYEQLRDKSLAQFELGTTEGETAHRYALFRGAGRTALYGRLLETRSPLNFRGTVEYHLPRNHENLLVGVPDSLASALERACIVCDAQRRLTQIIIDDGKMVLKSKSDTEEVTDEIPYRHKGNSRHEVKVEPKLLKRATDYDQMLINGPCIAMVKGHSVYLISCSTG